MAGDVGRVEVLCAACGYSLAGLRPGTRCPECGSEIGLTAASPPARNVRIEAVNVPFDGLGQMDRWYPPGAITAIGVFLVGCAAWMLIQGGWPVWVEALFGGAGLVALAVGVLMFREFARGRDRRITVDFEAGTVRFENFRLERPWRFPTRPIPVLIVDFDEILGAEVISGARGGSIGCRSRPREGASGLTPRRPGSTWCPGRCWISRRGRRP